ncbi:hypothetical protein [Nonomuraea sp. NPDC049480]|uniref:hypothetical protein n=1 Tax=Nonomuraea sp. NPDC049480 TaxID=3364353 RepID=UPI00378C578F
MVTQYLRRRLQDLLEFVTDILLSLDFRIANRPRPEENEVFVDGDDSARNGSSA